MRTTKLRSLLPAFHHHLHPQTEIPFINLFAENILPISPMASVACLEIFASTRKQAVYRMGGGGTYTNALPKREGLSRNWTPTIHSAAIHCLPADIYHCLFRL